MRAESYYYTIIFFRAPLFSALASSSAEGKYAGENLMLSQLGGAVEAIDTLTTWTVPDWTSNLFNDD
jgi:hypothetical protein